MSLYGSRRVSIRQHRDARGVADLASEPSEVYVITDEDIRQSGAIDIPTILRRIPGMEIMQTTGAEFNVSVRGDNQVRISCSKAVSTSPASVQSRRPFRDPGAAP